GRMSALFAPLYVALVSVQQLTVPSVEFRGEKWQHLVAIAQPDGADVKDHALVIVSGGKAGETALPDAERKRIERLAEAARMPVAMLRQVPNQPVLGGKT